MVERVTLGNADTPPDDPEAIAPEAPEESPEPQEEQPTDRPEWLPEKFSDPEDLAKAYTSLERKMSSQEAVDKGLLSSQEFEKYEDEYLDKGELTDKSYDTLVKKGLSRDLVDRYIEGRQLAMKVEEAKVYELTGGKEGYTAMATWMTESLPADEVDAYNSQIEVGGSNMNFAIKGMHARFTAAGGETSRAPDILQGTKADTVGGYGSLYEMKQDMMNPLYKEGDSRFHAMVDRRLSLSGNLT